MKICMTAMFSSFSHCVNLRDNFIVNKLPWPWNAISMFEISKY